MKLRNIADVLLVGLSILMSSAALAQTGHKGAPATGKDSESEYRLGPRDELTVSYTEADQKVDLSVQIDDNGEINFPLAGRAAAAGKTTHEVEDEIAQRLAKFIKDPQVSIQIKTFQSQPISIIGAVVTPGVHYMKGQSTLVEALALAGGVVNDSGSTVKVTRRIDENGRIPLPSARDNMAPRLSVAELSLQAVLNVPGSEENILIRPHDIISVPRAQLVYVIGEVTRAGGFQLNERKTMSVLQALSLAGGVSQDAAPKAAKIIRRPEESSKRAEVAVNIRSILAGKSEDIGLNPNDILFVPGNSSKKASRKILETAISTASGVAIYRSSRY